MHITIYEFNKNVIDLIHFYSFVVEIAEECGSFPIEPYL